MVDDRRPMMLVASGLLLLATVAASAEEIPAQLLEGRWNLRTPLGQIGGAVLLLRADGGADGGAAGGEAGGVGWRCEVAVAEDGILPSAADLRHRRGRGWTLVGGPDGGVVQPWSGPWRELGAEATVALGELVGAWAEGDGSGGRARSRVILRSWEALPPAWRPDSRSAAPPVGRLRRELTTRGGGRGGPGAVLRLVPAGRDLEVTSVRWPATLVVGPPASVAVRVPPEAFLPLWPLADLLP